MIYKLTEVEDIISRLDNDFNINYGDYINRLPQWVYQCLDSLKIKIGLIPKVHIDQVMNYYCNIPSDLHDLVGVEYQHVRLSRRNTNQYRMGKPVKHSDKVDRMYDKPKPTKEDEPDNTTTIVTIAESLSRFYPDNYNYEVSINELPVGKEYYYLIPNGKIETSFESGVVAFHYKIFPSKYNETTNSMCPLIPDNEDVKDAITWYVVQNLLQRGYRHPIFTLGNPNNKLDPYVRYSDAARIAKASAGKMDRDQERLADAAWQSALYNNISDPR